MTAANDAVAAPADKRLSPERMTREIARLDRAIVLAVLVLAFFLASFAVRNSDYWMHMATGRAVMQGTYAFGIDPFASTTEGVYWFNPSWLADVFLYGLSRVAGDDDSPGGALVVVLKALLVALLAGVMLAIRRPGRSIWLPAVCTALALVALSPHLVLRPVIVSYLFLVLTLWLLQTESRKTSARRLYGLPILFALWVNLDSWFLLGPLTVALTLLGHLAQKERIPDEGRTLAIVLALGLFACLLSPHHVHAVALPPELFAVWNLGALSADPGFAGLFFSPLGSGLYASGFSSLATSAAYFALLALGLVSFVLDFRSLRSWRGMLWATFALLSLANWRFMPFFAVVAGPITALNVQDAAERRYGTGLPESMRARRWLLSGRSLTLFALLLLLAAAWLGKVQPHADHPQLNRRVSWQVDADPSLRQAAREMKRWHDQGLLKAGSRGFNVSPEAANYCAWYCPEEKGFYDQRYPLFADVTDDALALRRRFLPLAGTADADARDVLRTRGIDRVILSGGDFNPTIFQLLQDPRQWVPLYMDGRTAILGWRDPEDAKADSFAGLSLDLDGRAFGANASRSPANGPERLAQASEGWRQWGQPLPPRPLDVDEALQYLLYFDAVSARERQALRTAIEVGPVSACLTVPPVFTAATIWSPPTGLAETLYNQALAARDAGPPAALVLALRAARRAVAASPDNFTCQLRLAQATRHLWKAQENHWAGEAPPPFDPAIIRFRLSRRRPMRLGGRQLLRTGQLAAALQQALALQPDAIDAHQLLAELYWENGYYDLALEHMRSATAARAADGQRFGELIQALEKEVRELRTDFELKTAQMTPTARALVALEQYGLAGQALAALDRADPAEFTLPDVELYLYLALTTGQVERMRSPPPQKPSVLADNLRAPLGPRYDRYQAFLAASLGDYARAGASTDKLLDGLTASTHAPLARGLSDWMAQLTQSTPWGQLTIVPRLRAEMKAGSDLHILSLSWQAAADLHVLRGLLALDEGDIPTARRHLDDACRLGESGVPFEARPVAERYRRLLREVKR